MNQQTFIKALIIFLLPLFFSCAVNPVTGRQELMLLSEQQEINIGKEAAPSLRWEFGGYYNDRQLESYLASIVEDLWRNSERSQLPFKFHIQNTSIPNAFALPGNIAITRGLLCEMENEAQFAAVMGHEIGHVMARHTAERITRVTLTQLGLAIGGAALQNTKGGDALLQVGAIGSSLLLLRYDRGQEIEADRLGVKYMARLGYDPYEAISAHTVLERSVDNYMKRLGKSRSDDSFISEILSTHPRAEVRISEIQAMINELPPDRTRGVGRFSSRFQSAITKIRGINNIYFIYDEAENFYQKENFSAAEESLKKAIALDDSQAPFYNLMGFIRIRHKNYTEAERSFQKSLSIDAEYQPSYYGLGLVNYFQENYREAINEFKNSLSLYPDHVQTHYGLGKTYFQMQQYKEALPYLKNFAQAVPKHPEIHGLLGICYEGTGNIRSAVTEYTYQLQIASDSEMGRYAKKRLTALRR